MTEFLYDHAWSIGSSAVTIIIILTSIKKDVSYIRESIVTLNERVTFLERK